MKLRLGKRISITSRPLMTEKFRYTMKTLHWNSSLDILFHESNIFTVQVWPLLWVVPTPRISSETHQDVMWNQESWTERHESGLWRMRVAFDGQANVWSQTHPREGFHSLPTARMLTRVKEQKARPSAPNKKAHYGNLRHLWLARYQIWHDASQENTSWKWQGITIIIQFASHLSKDKSYPKQKCAPHSHTIFQPIFYALSHGGMIHFVLSVSCKKIANLVAKSWPLGLLVGTWRLHSVKMTLLTYS